MAKTVLIIDDDAPTRGLFKAVIARAGLTSITASNGAEAIDIVEKRDDLCCIVLDLMMPVVDGTAVLAHLSSVKSAIPVIVCTAVGPLQSPKFDPAIVRAVVQKPFDVEQLGALVQRLARVNV